MRDCSTLLNKSIKVVMDTCPDDEFQAYRRVVGRVMGAIYLDIMQPIHQKYPELEPPELRRDDQKSAEET